MGSEPSTVEREAQVEGPVAQGLSTNTIFSWVLTLSGLLSPSCFRIGGTV